MIYFNDAKQHETEQKITKKNYINPTKWCSLNRQLSRKRIF